MITKKSVFGVCKPHKKWKKNNTKDKQGIKKEIEESLKLFKK
ncbi:MAG: hypothetical protein Q7K55_02785 [Candidatus Levybacteria bacterium]|nr:hypothetical protein [Candidatus Levybacteria bacterium]